MGYCSQAWQDEFAYHMLGHKQGGFFLDIGSAQAKEANNSFFFESVGWTGVCIEVNPAYAPGYADRTCQFVCDDATLVDYGALLKAPRIDYLSIDTDGPRGESEVLRRMPLDRVRFSVATIEHDAYRTGDSERRAQREILHGHGYAMIPDVLVPLECGMGPDLPFEDWWMDPATFDVGMVLAKLPSKKYPVDIVGALRVWLGHQKVACP